MNSQTAAGTGKFYVVISGLPGSGKSTLAHRLAPLLKLPVIDKDDILERLFDTKGTGNAEWKRKLSRESDRLFEAEALAAQGAILVSFWHLPGMAADSGTPAEWLEKISDRLIRIACKCAPEIAAERYCQRVRHPGHLDRARSKEEIQSSLRSVSLLGSLQIGRCIEVDTSAEHPELDVLVEQILDYFQKTK